MKSPRSSRFFTLILLLTLMACSSSEQQQNPPVKDSLAAVPSWAQDVVWYQIFVERFRNGDPANDPTAADITHLDPAPPGWKVTPWAQDWYQPDDWFALTQGGHFHDKVQFRRYGGDLQGVWDQLDYLSDLGVTAIYFNPLNDAPSMHKYDARNYHHIDRNFGPDPAGDTRIMAAENPGDPTTWQWTSADSLFLQIVAEMHRRGMRVVLDYSWNHTGTEFWAVKDIREKGKDSPYFDWYETKPLAGDPSGKSVEIVGWLGNKYLPVFKKDTIGENRHIPFEGNMHSEAVKNHIYAVSRRWLDPNGDGDPSDGIDGFRLDVAAEVPLGFWRDYRKVVRKINPEAILIGEIWWEEWPHKLMYPQPFLRGDIFDAIMNYRWYREARGFFAQAEPVLTASQFAHNLAALDSGIQKEVSFGMMNMSASHDAPRLLTSFANKTLYKYQAKPTENPEYLISKPGARTLAEVKLFLVHQFTYVGAPQIWNGDELGMWGADDPDCRKPLIWPDLAFDDEKAHLLPDQARQPEPVAADTALLAFYRRLIALRHELPALRQGEFQVLRADDATMTLAYARRTAEQEVIVAFNRSDATQQFSVPLQGNATYQNALNPARTYRAEGQAVTLEIGPLEYVVLVADTI